MRAIEWKINCSERYKKNIKEKAVMKRFRLHFLLLCMLFIFAPIKVASEIFVTDEYNANWGLGSVKASGAYAKGYTGAGVTIGIVDTGIATDHSEFTSKYKFGYDYVNNTLTPSDPHGHGSHVAGIAAAARDGVGMHGVAYGASLANGRGLNSSGNGSITNLLKAINYLADGGSRVINNSWGSASPITSFSKSYFDTFLPSYVSNLRSALANDALIVFAAGNDGASEVSVSAGMPYLYPEFESKWLVVGSLAQSGGRSSFSNQCGVAANFCLFAPGSEIKSVLNIGGYTTLSGTSMASPMVSGVAALVMEAFPYLTVEQIRTVLLTTATDLGVLGVDTIFGWGLVDAQKAVAGFKSFTSDLLEITDNTNSTWANDISGSGGFTKNGIGTLTLSGDNTYTGITNINAGTLVIEGNIVSKLNIAANATLSGDGLIGNDVVVSGILSPGESPGTLRVSGSLSLSSGSTTVMDIDGTGVAGGVGNYDRLILTGTDSVFTADGIIKPILRGISGSANNDFIPSLGESFAIISATGGINSGFHYLTQPSTGLSENTRFDLVYGTNKIDLLTTPGSYKLLADNLSPKRSIVTNLSTAIENSRLAAGVKSSGAKKIFFDSLYPLNEAEIGEAMVSLTGTIHSSLIAENINLKHDVMRQINARDRKARRARLASDSGFFWQIGSASFGNSTGDTQSFGYDFDRYDVLGGVDFYVNQNIQVGFGGGYLDSSVTEHAQKKNGSLKIALGFMSGEVNYNKFSSTVTIGASHNKYKAERLITFGVNGIVVGESDGTDIFGGFDVGYKFDGEKFTLSPSFGFSFASIERDGFDEDGTHPGRLSFSQSDVFSTRSRLALDGEKSFSMRSKNDLNLNVCLAWEHELSADGIAPEATLLDSKFRVNAVRPVKDMLQFSSRVGFSPSPRLLVNIGYEGNLGNKYIAHNFLGSLNFSF
jgi:subtilase-type serine protease